MQSASHLNPKTPLRPYPWNSRRIPAKVRSSLEKFDAQRSNCSPSSKTLVFSDLSTLSCRFKLGEIGEREPQNPLPLPIIIHRSGRSSRYFWDGTQFRLEGFDREPAVRVVSGDGFRRSFQVSAKAVRDLFVPRQVGDNFMGYLKWKLLHRVFSSALKVLATQAMFRAIGMGSSRSLPSAAAFNWVLKDGIGRFSKCLFTASVGSAFDTNLKRVRFSTSVLFTLSVGVELLTPVFPQYFLFLAAVANIAKSVSLAAYIATSSAIHRSFAIADNLGEVSAKCQIQTVSFDNLGLLLAALLNLLCKTDQRFQAGLPIIVYPIFSAIDLFAIYQGLKFVHLQTLTKDRLEIIIDTWIHSGYIPSPAEVSSKERIDFFMKKGSKLWPIRIGGLDSHDSSSMASLRTIQSLSYEDHYFICMEASRTVLTRKHQGILLCLRVDTGSYDIIMGLLQACLIRKTLLASRSSWECILRGGSAEDSKLVEWFKIVEDCKLCARRGTGHLIEELRNVGWALKNILLNSQEQVQYSTINGNSGRIS